MGSLYVIECFSSSRADLVLRTTLIHEAQRSYFSQLDESSRAARAQVESESFLQELAALAGSAPPESV